MWLDDAHWGAYHAAAAVVVVLSEHHAPKNTAGLIRFRWIPSMYDTAPSWRGLDGGGYNAAETPNEDHVRLALVSLTIAFGASGCVKPIQPMPQRPTIKQLEKQRSNSETSKLATE